MNQTAASRIRFARRICAALTLAGAGALALAGCRHGDDNETYPAVRVINTVQDSDNLAAVVGGRTIFGKVNYGDDSGYYGVQPGHYDVDIMVNVPAYAGRSAPPDSDRPSAHLDVAPAHRYTAVAYGSGSTPAHLAVFTAVKPTEQARKSAEQSGKATVRVFNAAAGSGKIDLLINSIVAFKNIPYGKRSDAIPLAALPYEWSVKPAGNSDQPYGSPTTLQLKGGKSYLVVVMGSAVDEDLQIKAFEE